MNRSRGFLYIELIDLGEKKESLHMEWNIISRIVKPRFYFMLKDMQPKTRWSPETLSSLQWVDLILYCTACLLMLCKHNRMQAFNKSLYFCFFTVYEVFYRLSCSKLSWKPKLGKLCIKHNIRVFGKWYWWNHDIPRLWYKMKITSFWVIDSFRALAFRTHRLYCFKNKFKEIQSILLILALFKCYK